MPWNEESFQKAKEHDKPILLDISAVWCHWCHVMDKTTYSNSEVARLIEELFVPIRVNRDQRPDIDKRYNMGGWYDIDCSPKQALLGRIRNKTPIKGLYLAGAKTFPGSGMFAVINAGLFTADAILNGKLTRKKMLLKA